MSIGDIHNLCSCHHNSPFKCNACVEARNRIRDQSQIQTPLVRLSNDRPITCTCVGKESWCSICMESGFATFSDRIARYMADPERCMPHERKMFEEKGFVASPVPTRNAGLLHELATTRELNMYLADQNAKLFREVQSLRAALIARDGVVIGTVERFVAVSDYAPKCEDQSAAEARSLAIWEQRNAVDPPTTSAAFPSSALSAHDTGKVRR